MYRLFLKRGLDFFISSVLIFIFLPLFILIPIIIWIALKEFPFFIQIRPGKDERLFKLIKFKTMKSLINNDNVLLPDQLRLTPLGRFFRKTSLDELPQLINVLLGDMSLIGPRPLLKRYLPFYYASERIRHTIRPGISGWAQVNGRNSIGWDKRLEMDIFYVRHVSFRLDFSIVIKTLQNVFTAKDIIIDNNFDFEDLDEERESTKDKKITESKVPFQTK